MEVLLSFTPTAPRMSLDELATRTGINKTTLLRIVSTLVATDFLIRRENTYSLGSNVLRLSNTYLSTLSLSNITDRPMERLANRFGQTVSLAVLDGADAVIVAFENSQMELGVQTELGSRQPVHATAVGKVLLSGLDTGAARTLLSSGELKKLTPHTLVTVDGVLASVELAKREGYATANEERGLGSRSVAAPIMDKDGRVVAAMGISGPTFYMREDFTEAIVRALLEEARMINVQMGWGE